MHGRRYIKPFREKTCAVAMKAICAKLHL